METRPQRGVRSPVPLAIRHDFLRPFKETHSASGSVSGAAFPIAHMEPIACHSAGEHLPARLRGEVKIAGCPALGHA